MMVPPSIFEVPRTSAQEAIKVDSLSPEAEAAAVEHGLDDNRTALVAAARETNAAPNRERHSALLLRTLRVTTENGQRTAPRWMSP
jgi:hypothetical protein